MTGSLLFSADSAERVAQITAGDIAAIIKLASLGQSAGSILDYAQKVADGEEPELDFEPGAPRPLVVQAWSFVRDRKQYAGTYGLSSAEAGDLGDLLETDSAAATAKIHGVVSAHLQKRGSTRPVRVTLDGAPRSVAGRAGPPPAGDGGLSLLREEIKRNSGVYGSYPYEAEATGRHGDQAFAVEIGGGLFAVGQSKAVAVAAARICSVKGRSDDLVRGRIVYWPEGGLPSTSSDIPLSAFDGRRGPHDALKYRPKAERPPSPPAKKDTPPSPAGDKKSPPASGTGNK